MGGVYSRCSLCGRKGGRADTEHQLCPACPGKEDSTPHRVPSIEESGLVGVGPWHPAHLLKSVGFHPAPLPVLDMGRWFCNSLGCDSWERQEGSLPQSGGLGPRSCLYYGRRVHPLCGSRWGPTLRQLPKTALPSPGCPGLDKSGRTMCCEEHEPK